MLIYLRMRDILDKNSVNKFYISIPNCHTGNEFKLKVSGLHSSLFVIIFPLIFKKNRWSWGENRKEPSTPYKPYNSPLSSSLNHQTFHCFCKNLARFFQSSSLGSKIIHQICVSDDLIGEYKMFPNYIKSYRIHFPHIFFVLR